MANISILEALRQSAEASKNYTDTHGGGGGGSTVTIADNPAGGVDLTVNGTTKTLAEEESVSELNNDLTQFENFVTIKQTIGSKNVFSTKQTITSSDGLVAIEVGDGNISISSDGNNAGVMLFIDVNCTLETGVMCKVFNVVNPRNDIILRMINSTGSAISSNFFPETNQYKSTTSRLELGKIRVSIPANSVIDTSFDLYIGEYSNGNPTEYIEPSDTYIISVNPTFAKEVLSKSENDILKGKKWAVLGDSFSYGSESAVFTEGKYIGKNKVYPYFIGNRTDINVIDTFFKSGRTLAFPAVPDGFNNSVTCPTVAWFYQNIPEDVDYITIYLGINDNHHKSASSGGDGEDNTGVIPLGTISDSTVNTYYGAWNVVLPWLMENRPNAHIGVLVSNGCEEEYRTAQIEICKKYGVPYIDLNGDERTPIMIRSSNPNIASSIKTIVNKKQAVDYIGGNLHPNDKAHEYESTFIENFLRSL